MLSGRNKKIIATEELESLVKDAEMEDGMICRYMIDEEKRCEYRHHWIMFEYPNKEVLSLYGHKEIMEIVMPQLNSVHRINYPWSKKWDVLFMIMTIIWNGIAGVGIAGGLVEIILDYKGFMMSIMIITVCIFITIGILILDIAFARFIKWFTRHEENSIQNILEELLITINANMIKRGYNVKFRFVHATYNALTRRRIGVYSATEEATVTMTKEEDIYNPFASDMPRD